MSSPTAPRRRRSCCAKATATATRSGKRTLLNLSSWPRDLVDGFRALLKGGSVIPAGQDALTIIRSLPHGHVAAVLGTLRRIGLDRLLGPDGNRCRDLAIALIASRIIAPASKLATGKALDPATAASSLGEVLGLGPVDEDELYTALDWLLARQPAVETALARRSLRGGTLVLYDVSSSYLEGRHCALARRGYNRDGKKGKLQIVYGLLCAADGCPVAIEVFDGDTADPATLASQISKLKRRFGVSHVVLVGDRGMITQARISEDVEPAGLDWITARARRSIKALVEAGALQLSLFDDRDLAEIASPDYPGERLIVCRNPLLAAQRRRKRADLLAVTERDLGRIKLAVERQRAPPRGMAEIGLQVGAVLDQHKMGKHYDLTITDTAFTYRRKEDAIATEARLDGMLRNPHQPAGRRPHGGADGQRLQLLGPGRARLPLPEDDRSGNAPGLPLAGRGCAPMSFGACRPTTSSCTCEPASRPCSSTMPTTTLRTPLAIDRRPHRARPRRSANRPPVAPMMACRCTASTACSAIWRR